MYHDFFLEGKRILDFALAESEGSFDIEVGCCAGPPVVQYRLAIDNREYQRTLSQLQFLISRAARTPSSVRVGGIRMSVITTSGGLLSTAATGDVKPLKSQFKAFGSPLGYAYGLENQGDQLGFVDGRGRTRLDVGRPTRDLDRTRGVAAAEGVMARLAG